MLLGDFEQRNKIPLFQKPHSGCCVENHKLEQQATRETNSAESSQSNHSRDHGSLDLRAGRSKEC